MRQTLIALEDWIDDDSCFLSLLKFFLIYGLAMTLLVGTIVFILGHFESKNPHIVLNKNEWSCTHSHVVMIPMMVGKIVAMMPEQVCDAYQSNSTR